MQKVGKILSVVILSTLLIFIGKELNFVECAHSHSINLAILSQHSTTHSDCHNNKSMMSEECMTYKSISVSPSQISANIDLPNIVCVSVLLFLPIFQEKKVKQEFVTVITIFKPPKDYLRSLRVLII